MAMKKASFVLMLFFAFALNAEVGAQGAAAGRIAGEQAANERYHGPTWFAVGCLTLGMSYMYPVMWPPKAPQSALIGQDVAYVSAYAEAYEKRVSQIIQGNSCIGWVMGLFNR